MDEARRARARNTKRQNYISRSLFLQDVSVCCDTINLDANTRESMFENIARYEFFSYIY